MTIWVKVMKLFKRKELEKCDACGRRIADKPVKIEVNGEIKTFCCEHCAEAYIKSRGHTRH
ncbi:MAG: transcriptional regulator [Thermoprotei archaeon]|nr:MAG: transcriptional regulator [Thermoprotei archaeon]